MIFATASASSSELSKSSVDLLTDATEDIGDIEEEHKNRTICYRGNADFK